MFRFDMRNLLFLFLAIVLINLFLGSFDIYGTLLMLPGLILALTFHEFAHARMADRLGDPTPESQGRLTLNPLAHMDPMGTICLLFAGFGWGKPVQVNPSYFRNPAKDNMLVALAGPVMNFILAFLLFFVLAIMTLFIPITISGTAATVVQILMTMILYGATLNVSLGVFNLLPVPPLDGSKIFAYFLHGKAKEVLYTLERYSWIIIIILFITEIPSYIISPVVGWITSGMLTLVGWIVTGISFVIQWLTGLF